jgi:TonB-linked SusC/RagA family outer membrane protein
MASNVKLIPTIFLLSITIFTYGQKRLSLQLTNCPAEKAFQIIREKSGYDFILDNNCLEYLQDVTITCTDKPLKTVLTLLCLNKPVMFSIKEGIFVISERPIDVSGPITNEQNQPLPGVTIQLKHADRSTISNSNGTFFIKNVSRKDTLLLSAPGMKTEIVPVNGRSVIPIQLKYDGLPAVTVLLTTGFQRMPVSLATGSVAVAGREMLSVRPNRSIEKALEGSVSGLNTVANKTAGINQPRYFQVGARGTLNGDPEPLIILDQFPYQDDLNHLNNDDIESVTILKDASVASIWGARGANGVVVISTKKAKYADPLKISFNNYVTVGSKPNLFYPDALGPNDRINIDTFLFNQGYTLPIEQFTSLPLSPVLELLIANRDGRISREEFEAQLAARRNHDARNDQLKYFYRKPVTSHWFTDITYGNHLLNFRAAVGFDEGRPIVQHSKDNRKTGNISLTARLIPAILEVSGSLNGASLEQQNTGDVPILPAIYEPLTDQDGTALSQPIRYREGLLNALVNQYGLLDWRYYPKTEFDLRDQTLIKENLRGQVNVAWKAPEQFIRGLEFLFSSQYQLSTSALRDLQHQQSYRVRDLVNHFTIITPVFERVIPWGNILDLSKTKREAYNTRWQLSYQQNWPNCAQISLMAGVDRMRTKEGFYASRTYGYSITNPTGQSNIDYTREYALTNPEPGLERIPKALPSWNSNKILISYFSSVGFIYKRQLNVSVTGRIDRSNVFGLVKNQHSIPLLGVGVSWDMHYAPWYHLSKSLPELTIRTTYGTLGNIAGSPTLFPTITPEGTNSSGDRMSLASNPPLHALKWEKMKVLNIGVNFTFHNKVISGSIDYFNKRSADLLDETPIDPTTGDVSVQGNSAKMRASQLDIVLNAQIMKRRLGWNARLLFSKINETITACSNPERPAWEYCEFAKVRSVQGHAPYDIYSFKYRGLDNAGDPVGMSDGEKSKDYGKMVNEKGYENLVHNGRSIPGIYGSLLNEFVWQQFNLTTLFLYEFNFYYRRHSMFYNETFAGTELGSRDFNRAPNVPAMKISNDDNRDLFYKYSEALIERGDNIRLQLVNLSYALNPKWIAKWRLSACSVYINGNNLGIISRAGNKSVDPRHINGLPDRPEFSFGIRATTK